MTDPTKTCPTCGFRTWDDGAEVCTHPVLAQSILQSPLLPIAFRLCEGDYWAEQEDSE